MPLFFPGPGPFLREQPFDEPAVSGPAVVTATDALGTTDVATRDVQAFTRAASDTLGTTDVGTRAAQVFTRSASDSLTTSDSATRATRSLTRAATEALATSDSATRSTAFARTAREYLTPDYRTLVFAESTAASYIRLGEANGSSTVADSVGSVTGTVGSGITLGVTGLLGGDANTAAQGVAGTIDFGDNYDFANNSPFTIEFILKPSAFGQRVVAKADGSGGWSVDLDSTGHVVAARRG